MEPRFFFLGSLLVAGCTFDKEIDLGPTGGAGGQTTSTGGVAPQSGGRDGGGTPGTGGVVTGGTASGGAAAGGVVTGGTATSGSGGGATGGTATGGVATGGAAAGGAQACPGTGGPSMVQLPEGYCIDSTEVTRAQYAAWLNQSPSTAGQISDCTWNTTFTPNASCMAWSCQTGCDNHPQVCVDWCDAYAYCQAVGKRLCGKIGGGSNGYRDPTDANLSQWYNACTSHNPTVNTYPYGTSYDAQACNGPDYAGTSDMTVEVGTLSTCQSSVTGYSGVYDLSGNVYEWEDSCDVAGEFASCRVRGGSFSDSYDAYNVTCGVGSYVRRDDVNRIIGLRCCAP